jgi:hypothetical protein
LSRSTRFWRKTPLTEIHPDAYDDPEEDLDWELPLEPDPALVPEDTGSWWVFYNWRGRPNQWQWPLSVAVTREITHPWRRGLGIMLRRKQRAFAWGVWTRGKAPRILSDAPAEKDWQAVAMRAENLENGSERN